MNSHIFTPKYFSMLTLYGSLSVQIVCFKKNIPLLQNTLLLKNANYHLKMLGCHKPSICKRTQLSVKHIETRYARILH